MKGRASPLSYDLGFGIGTMVLHLNGDVLPHVSQKKTQCSSTSSYQALAMVITILLLIKVSLQKRFYKEVKELMLSVLEEGGSD